MQINVKKLKHDWFELPDGTVCCWVDVKMWYQGIKWYTKQLDLGLPTPKLNVLRKDSK